MFGLLRTLWTRLSGTRRRGYTLRGFWGQRKHYNKDGVQIGYSVKGFWGGWKRYDMDGNLISYTLRNFWGGYDTYDADGNLIRKSRRNFGGGIHTYDTTGKRVTESYRSFWGGVDHYEADAPAEVPKTVAEMPVKTNPTLENNVAKPTPQVAVPIQTEKVTVPPMPKPAEDKEDSFVHRDSQEYNDLLRSIDDMGAGKFEFREMSTEKDSVNILVFSYGKLKEFPAQAIFAEDTLRVVPLIKGVSGFTVPKEEITRATRKVVDDMDGMDIENEFSSLNSSALLSEFDDLLPEYEYGINGVSRAQYEFHCGLILTENSWLKLCAEMAKC